MSKSKVSMVKTSPHPNFAGIRRAVEGALSLLGGIDDLARAGKKILLTPSWVVLPRSRRKDASPRPRSPKP